MANYPRPSHYLRYFFGQETFWICASGACRPASDVSVDAGGEGTCSRPVSGHHETTAGTQGIRWRGIRSRADPERWNDYMD